MQLIQSEFMTFNEINIHYTTLQRQEKEIRNFKSSVIVSSKQKKIYGFGCEKENNKKTPKTNYQKNVLTPRTSSFLFLV